jgi:hypothetical protein
LSQARPLRRKVPSRDSILAFFVIGALLLVIPLFLVLFVGEPCAGLLPGLSGIPICATLLYKQVVAALPYFMLVGGVIIGYNLKRVSDSLLPPVEEDDDL